MSELGSIKGIILVCTGQTDLKRIVNKQNNKMLLFYFRVVGLIILKAEPDC